MLFHCLPPFIVSDEKSTVSCINAPLYAMSHFLSQPSRFFSLSLAFGNLTLAFLGVIIIIFIIFGVSQASWISRWILSNLETFWSLFFQIFFFLSLSHLLLPLELPLQRHWCDWYCLTGLWNSFHSPLIFFSLYFVLDSFYLSSFLYTDFFFSSAIWAFWGTHLVYFCFSYYPYQL